MASKVYDAFISYDWTVDIFEKKVNYNDHVKIITKGLQKKGLSVWSESGKVNRICICI